MVICLRDRLHRRAGHVAFQHGGQMFIWGGLVEHTEKKPRLPNTISTNSNDLHDTDEAFVYSPDAKSWRRICMRGELPPRTFGQAWCVVSTHLYVFGGHQCYESDPGYVEGNNNHLYELSFSSWTWSRVRFTQGEAWPCEKTILVNHGHHLYTFGGYGGKCHDVDDDFILDQSSHWQWRRGWGKSLYRFHLFSKRWEKVNVKGERPCARAGHAGVVLGDQFVLHGGRGPRGRLNDLWMLDLNSLRWTEIINSHDSSWPEARSLHTLTVITGERALLYGGINSLWQPTNDCWILNVSTLSDTAQATSVKLWQELPLPYDHGEVRCWHCACAVDGGAEVLVHSGLTQEFYLNRAQLDDHPEDVLAIQVGLRSLRRGALEAIVDILCLNEVSIKAAQRYLAASLPANLAEDILSRVNEEWYEYDPDPPAEEPFDRDMIHEGI